MTRGHLRATLWLRWRMLVNRVRRAGRWSHLMFGLVALLTIGTAALSFGFAFELGRDELRGNDFVAWVVLTLIFLFSWLVGLLAELQNSDSMSLRKLVHLPISLRWAFAYNYVSSIVSLSVVMFVPGMLGLALARGLDDWRDGLLSLTLVLAFLGMVSALTYQLRAWLSHLMEDKRRGRNIVALVTAVLVLLLQLPNLVNLSLDDSDGWDELEQPTARITRSDRSAAASPGSTPDGDAEAATASKDGETTADGVRDDASTTDTDDGGPSADDERTNETLTADSGAAESDESRSGARGAEPPAMGTFTPPPDFVPVEDARDVRSEHRRRRHATYQRLARTGARWLPIGWMALGTAAWTEGRPLIAVASLAGMLMLMGASLALAYRGSSRRLREPVGGGGAIVGDGPLRNWLEWRPPFVRESVGAIALTSARHLSRAPEAKMLLLGPLFLLVFFGFLLTRQASLEDLEPYVRWMAFGASSMTLVSISQLTQNQFGLDRDGFRAWLLAPCRREDLLLGKNLSVLPFALGLGSVALTGLFLLVPARIDVVVGAFLQLVSAYFMSSLVGNAISILGPLRLKPGMWKADNPRWKTIVWQMVAVLLLPIAFAPLTLPALATFLWSSVADEWPLYSVGHAVLLVVVYAFYRFVVRLQGGLLEERETRVLELLTRS